MRSSKIRALIRLVEESDINELEVSSWGRKVSIRKNISNNGNSNGNRNSRAPAPKIEESIPQLEVTTESSATQEVKTSLVPIKSPMVGTYYRSPAPDAKPYVEIGQDVKQGQVVCIIEAMKLMNEIESDVSGRIVEILVDNARPVEFDQPLFLVDPS